MDEHKRIAERERGARAKILLEDDLLDAAFIDIESALTKAWRDSSSGEVQRREDAWRSLRLLEKLRGTLEHHVNTGKLAEMELLKAGDTDD